MRVCLCMETNEEPDADLESQVIVKMPATGAGN